MLFFFNQPSDKYPTIHIPEILSEEESFEISFSITTKKRQYKHKWRKQLATTTTTTRTHTGNKLSCG